MAFLKVLVIAVCVIVVQCQYYNGMMNGGMGGMYGGGMYPGMYGGGMGGGMMGGGMMGGGMGGGMMGGGMMGGGMMGYKDPAAAGDKKPVANKPGSPVVNAALHAAAAGDVLAKPSDAALPKTNGPAVPVHTLSNTQQKS